MSATQCNSRSAAKPLTAILRRYSNGRSRSECRATAFEVATIRPNINGGPQCFSLFPEFMARNATLKDLVTPAYDVKPFQVFGGPGWINADHYDISAKAADTPTPTNYLSLLVNGQWPRSAKIRGFQGSPLAGWSGTLGLEARKRALVSVGRFGLPDI
jgi:hypothetical protein